MRKERCNMFKDNNGNDLQQRKAPNSTNTPIQQLLRPGYKTMEGLGIIYPSDFIYGNAPTAYFPDLVANFCLSQVDANVFTGIEAAIKNQYPNDPNFARGNLRLIKEWQDLDTYGRANGGAWLLHETTNNVCYLVKFTEGIMVRLLYACLVDCLKLGIGGTKDTTGTGTTTNTEIAPGTSKICPTCWEGFIPFENVTQYYSPSDVQLLKNDTHPTYGKVTYYAVKGLFYMLRQSDNKACQIGQEGIKGYNLSSFMDNVGCGSPWDGNTPGGGEVVVGKSPGTGVVAPNDCNCECASATITEQYYISDDCPAGGNCIEFEVDEESSECKDSGNTAGQANIPCEEIKAALQKKGYTLSGYTCDGCVSGLGEGTAAEAQDPIEPDVTGKKIPIYEQAGVGLIGALLLAAAGGSLLFSAYKNKGQ
jgi:hypothetical protein